MQSEQEKIKTDKALDNYSFCHLQHVDLRRPSERPIIASAPQNNRKRSHQVSGRKFETTSKKAPKRQKVHTNDEELYQRLQETIPMTA